MENNIEEDPNLEGFISELPWILDSETVQVEAILVTSSPCMLSTSLEQKETVESEWEVIDLSSDLSFPCTISKMNALENATISVLLGNSSPIPTGVWSTWLILDNEELITWNFWGIEVHKAWYGDELMRFSGKQWTWKRCMVLRGTHKREMERTIKRFWWKLWKKVSGVTVNKNYFDQQKWRRVINVKFN